MKIKKIVSLMSVGIMALGLLTGCGQKEVKFDEPIKIATLNGPTGMGMTQMIHDANENYDITLYQSADEIVGKIISGEMDIACVPSNLAAVLYKKTENNIYLLGTNTLGVLYIVENGDTVHSLEDLRGKKIIASGKGSTPEYVLNELLSGANIKPDTDVEIEYVANHTDVVTELVANEGTIALLPQPHVTVATSKNEKVHIALDLNEAWESQEGTNLPMGVIIAQKDFVDTHKEEVNAFLKDYKDSVKFVNNSSSEAAEMMATQGILPSVEIALTAIPNCHITFIDGKTARADLEQFYTILQNVNPQSIGGSLPDEAFYYGE